MVVTDDDGTTVIRQPNGMVTTRYKDGTVVTNFGGTTTVVKPDGTMITR